MRSDREEKNRLVRTLRLKLEENAQIVARATRPNAVQIALELVRLQLWVESIVGESFERSFEFRRGLRVLLQKTPRGSLNAVVRNMSRFTT